MKKINITIVIIGILFFTVNLLNAQNFGIVRKNYFSYYYDSSIMENIEVFDSATIRLGSIDPVTGVVSNVGNKTYNKAINLNGATLDPYLNRYYIGSGKNLLTFDMKSGDLINNVPITGSLPSFSFQNLRFNPSDSKIYGLVPNNFYSTYYDSSLNMNIEVLDSTQIRFGTINPVTGKYTIIGNTSFDNMYTLAGNSIDPYQMIYYYSAVDTLIGIDLFTGGVFNTVPINLPSTAIFENITYSCIDTAIYGLTRQNYFSLEYDSLVGDYLGVLDSVTYRLTKINPASGVITIISPYNIGTGGSLTNGSFIDPNTMTYYFSNGNQIVGASLVTGLITSAVTKTYASGAFALEMMRSTRNCFGAEMKRTIKTAGNQTIANNKLEGILFPNPAKNEITLKTNKPYKQIEILDYKGTLLLKSKESTINISTLPDGIYFAKVTSDNGVLYMGKFVKM